MLHSHKLDVFIKYPKSQISQLEFRFRLDYTLQLVQLLKSSQEKHFEILHSLRN
jgi:hypothetical protein